jgi:hypothetical protein
MPDAADRSSPFANPLLDYLTDAAQRTILFWDVMRQRGNQYREHAALSAPHVLSFGFDLVMDGRKLDRPVNYGIIRIRPSEDVLAPATGLGSGASRPTAKSALRWPRATHATSSDSCRSPFRARPSRTSPKRRRNSSSG